MPSYPHPSSALVQDVGADVMRGLLSGDATVLDRALGELSAEEVMDLHDAAMLLVDSIRLHARHVR